PPSPTDTAMGMRRDITKATSISTWRDRREPRSSSSKGCPRAMKRVSGPKSHFSAGFELGLKAGYGDGYAGRVFRAVDEMRAVAGSLKEGPDKGDANNIYFDRGVSLGYKDGFAQGHSRGPSAATATSVDSVKCVYTGKASEAPGETSYCDGYRRGFVL